MEVPLGAYLNNRHRNCRTPVACFNAIVAEMTTHIIDGMTVTCELDENRERVWKCTCADFERRRAKFNRGFCVHAVSAMEGLFSSPLPDVPADPRN